MDAEGVIKAETANEVSCQAKTEPVKRVTKVYYPPAIAEEELEQLEGVYIQFKSTRVFDLFDPKSMDNLDQIGHDSKIPAVTKDEVDSPNHEECNGISQADKQVLLLRSWLAPITVSPVVCFPGSQGLPS